MELKDAQKMELDDILDVVVLNSLGDPVVLRNVVKEQSGSGPTRIERKDQQRIVTVSGNLAGDPDMGAIVKDMQ